MIRQHIILDMAERVGFEPTVRLPVQRFSSSKISHAGTCHVVPNCALWFTVFTPMIPACYARCHAVPRGSFENPFANILHQPMSALPDKADTQREALRPLLTQSGHAWRQLDGTTKARRRGK